MSDIDRKSSARSAGVVGIAVMCSRLLGLVREQVFAGLFGAGRNYDIFLIAFRVPNLLRDLFAEGALSTAFVTTFSKKIATDGDESAWALAHKVATLTAIFMSAVTLVGILFSRQLIKVIGWGFTPDEQVMTVLLTQIMWPFILLVSLAALVMGMLNAKHVFGMPAMASTFFNVGSILGGVGFGWWLDPHFGRRALIGLALGTLVGGLLQFVVQLPSLRKAGYRFRLDFAWRDEGVRAVLRLMAPAIIAASAVQVNVLVNSSFASVLEKGAVSWLSIAFRLMQLPLGIFGVAIGTVTLPLVSRSAALGNTEEFRAILARGIRLAFFLTVPSTIGLILLARPIISVIYEHGRFTPVMTAQTAAALQFYAIGLAAYSALKVLTPAFYAIDRRKTPMMISFLSIGMNLLLNWLFTFHLKLGHRGLALSTGLVATANFLIQYSLMRHHARGLETGQLLTSLGKIGIAGLALGVCCWVANGSVLAGWQRMHFPVRVFSLLGTITVAGGGFFAAAFALRLEEMRDVIAVFQRRFARGRGGS